MGRRKKPLIEGVEISKIAAEGKSIAYVDEKVLFVPNTVPGDIVDVQVTRKRKNFMEGFVVNMIKESPIRIAVECTHFGICGGCKWQNIPYELQTEFKQSEVEENLKRIGGIDLKEISPIIKSEKIYNYRNKLEFTFSNKRFLSREEIQSDKELNRNPALGFHVPGLFDKVVDIEKCYLQEEPSNAIRNFIKEYALKHNLEFLDIRNKEGFLRTLIIRTSSIGEIMVILTFYRNDEENIQNLLKAIADKFPEITSLMYVVNEKANDTISDLDINLYKGNDHIYEQMEDLTFKIGPKSFYQTNSEQAYLLYSETRRLANLSGNEIVYDLYTGTGTIANFIAKRAKKVIGIEYVPEAIEDAKVNSINNKIDNTLFFAGDMKDVLNNDFIIKHGAPDIIITDPPRAGMHADVVNVILDVAPKRIVYVSCNSATQARDIKMLDVKYEVKAVQPVDMFPHTHHVENIVLLEKK